METRSERSDASSDEPLGKPVVGPVVPDHWQFWNDGAHDGIWNMAADSVLLDRVRATDVHAHARHPHAMIAHTEHAHDANARHVRTTDTGTPGIWRTYGWRVPTVSFGRHERTAGRFDADTLAAAGLAAARRPTGGRAVLHARELTYCVAMPLAPEHSWRDAYAAINRILLRALRAMGIDAAVAIGADLPAGDALCFAAPAMGEIVVGASKLVGSAVWRRDGGYLQHGSILLHDTQASLVDAAAGRVAAPPAAATLGSLLSSDDSGAWDAMMAVQFQEALRMALATDAHVTTFADAASLTAPIEQASRQLGSDSWLWRR